VTVATVEALSRDPKITRRARGPHRHFEKAK